MFINWNKPFGRPSEIESTRQPRSMRPLKKIQGKVSILHAPRFDIDQKNRENNDSILASVIGM